MKLFFSVILTVGFGIISSCQLNPKSDVHLAISESNNTYKYQFIETKQLIDENWINQPQTKFWMKIMRLSPDSCLINIASNRLIVEKKSRKSWGRLSSIQKEAYRDSIRTVYHLDSTDKINVTTGKSDFYRFNEVYPTLPQGIIAFEKNEVDPWYAQVILLIESPATLKKSSAGAYGPFQLMPGVARNFGLTVNKLVDERADFERSAYAASSLLKTICIPETKQILQDNGYTFDETDWWFKLLVLHVYHAGAFNVRKVVASIGNLHDGKELIKRMWHTKIGRFGNNSQNYTQLALAALSILHSDVEAHGKIEQAMKTEVAKANGKM